MLVDIEMPRMDGFELTSNVRATSTLAHIPIIMVTSRDADKHRRYALSSASNAFLGKPYQEDELLGQVARFLDLGARPCGLSAMPAGRHARSHPMHGGTVDDMPPHSGDRR